MHFTFGSPYFLFLLLLLPCFIWCKTEPKRFYFPKIAWVSRQYQFFTREPWLKIVIFTLMVTALAKPFVYDANQQQHRKGRDLILALDASGSMAQSGFDSKDTLKSKFESTVVLASNFIQKRFDDNMGIVIFGTFAYTASPLTYDTEALQYLLHMTNVGIAGESTAIGDAIMQSLRTLSFGDAKKQAIVLLTDGYHNAGNTSPKEAVAIAKKRGIKIYTIGVGKKSDYDVALLETIAKNTGGVAYHASSAEDLKNIYETINALEPSKIRSENYLNQNLLIPFPLGMALILLLAWIVWQERREA